MLSECLLLAQHRQLGDLHCTHCAALRCVALERVRMHYVALCRMCVEYDLGKLVGSLSSISILEELEKVIVPHCLLAALLALRSVGTPLAAQL